MHNDKKVCELFSQLEEAGFNPEYCDKPAPYYDNSVMCGNPNVIGDLDRDAIWLPSSLWAEGLIFRVKAKGDSMKGAGIDSGDELTISCERSFYDGDVVLACINGEYTLKAYYRDTFGRQWLVPRNDAYRAILIKEDMDVRFVGRVIEIAKRNPRVASRDCEMAIRQTLDSETAPVRLTEPELTAIIREVAPKIISRRLWYAVFRPLVDKEYERRGQYDTFCSNVARWVPGHEHLPTPLELQRIAIMSFDKPVRMWDKENAPVQGKRFEKYLQTALYVLDKLTL